MISTGQQVTGTRFPKEVKGKYVMWTLKITEKYYNDGTVEKVGSYQINKSFLKALPKSRIKFDENSSLIEMADHFNTNVIGRTRVAVVAESFANRRNESVTTLKEFKKLKQTITDLVNRPKISLAVALKFKLMLEYYGFTDILVE